MFISLMSDILGEMVGKIWWVSDPPGLSRFDTESYNTWYEEFKGDNSDESKAFVGYWDVLDYCPKDVTNE